MGRWMMMIIDLGDLVVAQEESKENGTVLELLNLQ
jgi:hypothetical protein